MCKLLYKYGDNGIMRWKTGMMSPSVLICNPQYIAELFANPDDDLTFRKPGNISFLQYTGGCKDILMSSGDYWKKARKAFMRGVMTSVGRSIPLIEKVLKESIEKIRVASKNGAEPVLVSQVFREQTFSVIAEFATGRCPIPEEKMKQFIRSLSELDPYLSSSHYRNLIPGYTRFQFEDRFVRLLKQRDSVLQYIIDEHQKTLDPNNPADFLDTVLVDKMNDGELSIVSTLHLLLDTYLGGTDTSSSTMEFFAGLMANYPNVQAKVHAEIDAMIGKRLPTVEDEEKLPYLCATLKEVMRIYPVAGYGRHLQSDIKVGKYTLKKGTRVLVMNLAVTRNPQIWHKPDEFIPERFLEEKDGGWKLRGTELPKDADQIKLSFFGLGKRGCPGYLLAKKELFLQTVYYMQAFEFSRVSEKKIDLTMVPGLVAKPRGPLWVNARYRL
jgi:cytochrome P450